MYCGTVRKRRTSVNLTIYGTIIIVHTGHFNPRQGDKKVFFNKLKIQYFLLQTNSKIRRGKDWAYSPSQWVKYASEDCNLPTQSMIIT